MLPPNVPFAACPWNMGLHTSTHIDSAAEVEPIDCGVVDAALKDNPRPAARKGQCRFEVSQRVNATSLQ